ncbi:MAG TPA: glycosyltransferase family 4 protein [Gemmatimonadales bacterium]|jgi:glycosyltransferase involved in cell wall biosynthesis
MRIVLLISANGWRGSGVSFAKIGQGLLDRGHTIHLVTAVPRVTSRFTALGLPVTQLARRDTGPREVWELLRILRKTRAQAVVADSPRDVRLSAYATLLHRVPIVYRYNLNERPRSHLMDRIYMSRVAACVYQSRYIREQAYVRAPRLKHLISRRIPNGYDTAAFTRDPAAGLAFRERHGIPPSRPVVLSSAKLTRRKGHDVAMEALNLVRREGTDFVYVICGDGGQEKELRAHAEELALPSIFTGLLESKDMIAALSAADVVIHPSLREIFPNAVGEAMSCGCAVIAADAGGTAELLGDDGRTGVLVPPGEPYPLAEAVQLLLADRELREELGAAARLRIEEEFPLIRMIDGYETGLARVVSGRG